MTRTTDQMIENSSGNERREEERKLTFSKNLCGE